MAKIELETRIRAPIDRVFDLARSIDLHTKTASRNKETAIAGRTEGLIGPGETVTWNAVHFRVRLSHTSLITEYNRPRHFRDSMVNGAFSRLDHDHYFEEAQDGTVMRDLFDFDAPFPLIGKLVEFLFLETYLKGFLERRNAMIKEVAEGEEWRRFLP